MSDQETLFDSYTKLSPLLGNLYEQSFDNNKEKLGPISEQIKEQGYRYGEEKKLTSGGMKTIYTVEDFLTGHPIAKAKILNEPTNDAVELFFREAQITAGLEHPNIVPIYDIGFDHIDEPFFTMKLLTGDSLKTVLDKLKAKDPHYLGHYTLSTKLNIFMKICEAINFAHTKGVLHLDLKPANIQLGEFGEVYVCDWGLAKIISQPNSSEFFDTGVYNTGTVFGDIKGTPGFMAPEQIKNRFGKKTKQTDIYSLGALLFSLLNLRPPFHKADMKHVLELTTSEKLPEWPNHSIPNSLKAVCERAMMTQPKERYNSVSELHADISAYLNGFATKAEGASFFDQLKLFVRRNKLIVFSILSFSIIIAILSIISIVEISNKEKKAVNALKLYKAQQKETLKVEKLYTNERILSELQLKKQQESDAILQKNRPTLLILSKHNIYKKNYENAIKLLTIVTNHYPKDEEALLLLGRSYMMCAQFKEAKDIFRKIKTVNVDGLMRICEQFKNKSLPLSDEDLLELLTIFVKRGKQHAIAVALLDQIPVVNYRDSFIPVLEQAILISNPKLTSVNFKVERKNRFNYVDLSNNPQLKDIRILERLYLKGLNISNTAIQDLSSFLNKPNFSELDISNSQVEDVDMIKQFKNLQKLTIAKGQLTEDQIEQLPRKIKLIYR